MAPYSHRPASWEDVEGGHGKLVNDSTAEGGRADVASDAHDVVNEKALTAEQAIFLRLSEIEEGERRKARERRVLLAGGAALILLALLLAAGVAIGVTAGKGKCQGGAEGSNDATSAEAMLTQQQQGEELLGTVQIGGEWGNVSTVVARLDIRPNSGIHANQGGSGGGATTSWGSATWQTPGDGVEDISAAQQQANPEVRPVSAQDLGGGAGAGAGAGSEGGPTDPYDYPPYDEPPAAVSAPSAPSPAPPSSPSPSPAAPPSSPAAAAPSSPSPAAAAPPPAAAAPPPAAASAAAPTPPQTPAAEVPGSSSNGPTDILSRIAALIKPPDLSVQGIDFQNGHLSVSGPDSWSFSLEPFKEISLDLTSLINVAAVVSNPNPIEIIAQEVTVDVSFYSVDVGYANIPDFTLPANSSATITVPFNIDNFPLLSFSDQSLITGSIANGELEFQVVISLKARTRILQSTTPAFNVQLVCNAVVNPTQNNVLSKSCSTNIAA
ncbi:hypothetical protein CLOP_g22635 [Closterium sp. NIES-67]|nr:hypothetical protein CLOP_g21937 [Closterium sp. NIES-67]GJP65777.1 hypothetical protein CLOP_g22635 [Closterium sp. NIES-67]